MPFFDVANHRIMSMDYSSAYVRTAHCNTKMMYSAYYTEELDHAPKTKWLPPCKLDVCSAYTCVKSMNHNSPGYTYHEDFKAIDVQHSNCQLHLVFLHSPVHSLHTT